MDNEEKIKVFKAEALQFSPTQREGVTAAKIIDADDSVTQNLAVVEIEAEARVEDHEISGSESIYVLQGAIEVKFDDTVELLLPGDLVYFPAGSSHSLEPKRTPCRLLLIFSS